MCRVRSFLIDWTNSGPSVPIPVCFAENSRRLSFHNDTLFSGRFLTSSSTEIGRMTRGGAVGIMNGLSGYYLIVIFSKTH